MKHLLPIFILSCCSLACAADYQCVKTDNGAKLTMSEDVGVRASCPQERVVWELVVKTPEGKPYIHPISLPDGQVITDLRPKDHVWHTGLWFSWKFINRVNYWEPSDGKTEVESWDVAIDGLQATATIKLKYYNIRQPDVTVLTEKRTIVFSAPDDKGNYSITSKHHFTVGATDITLDRTPLAKAPWGGYAGLTLRMNSSTNGFKLSCDNGGTDYVTVRSKSATWVDFRNPNTGQGIRYTVIKGTEPLRFYTQVHCLIASPVHDDSIFFKANDSFDLEFKLEFGR